MSVCRPAGVMRVWYRSDWSDTEAMKRSPPCPDPESALKVSIITRLMVEEDSSPSVNMLEDIVRFTCLCWVLGEGFCHT